MATRAILAVVVVRDAGLRSTLAAHLSIDGFELLTASSIAYGLLGSTMIRSPSVLVIDEALIPCDPERWIETQRGLRDWDHLVVVSGAASPLKADDDWAVRITERDARKLVPELLAGWARDERPTLGKNP